MAYREFYKRQDILLDDNSPIERGIANFFTGISAAREKRKKASDEYKYALDYGHFANDNAFNEQFVKNTIALGKQDFKTLGAPSDTLLAQEEAGRRFAADQKAQYKMFTDINASIDKRGTEDPFYNPSVDKENLRLAAFGNDNDIDFRTRGERLEQVSKVIGRDPRSFKLDDYTAHFVKNRGQKEQEQKTGSDLTGVTTTYSYKTPFIDPKTGKPGVTDQHAVEFLKSRDEVTDAIQFKVDMELLEDVKAIQQLSSEGDARAKWAKGLTRDEILTNIKTDASKNPFNKQAYNDRVIEKTKKYLTDASDIAEKTLVDYKKPQSSGGGVNNDNIGHTNTFFNNKIEQRPFVGPTDANNPLPSAPKSVSGPGGLLMIKKGVTAGRPIVIEANSKQAFNYRDGKNIEREGRGAFNLTGYQLLPYTADGRLYPLEANSFEELKAKVNSLSPEVLRTLSPDLQIGLNGFSVDKAALGGDILNESFKLNEQLGEAMLAGDTEKQARIQSQIQAIDEVRAMMNLDGVSDEDIVNAASKSGIKSIRTDQILKADKSDLDYIKTVTEGLDLTKQQYWSPEMKELSTLYKQKHASAMAGNTPKKTAKPKSNTVRVQSPDGKTGTIPAEDLEEAIAQGYKKID
jgi:hypothetical protein